jgi:RNA recognition motif-containing protein
MGYSNNISNRDVPRNAEGKSRGFGVIKMKNAEDAEKAIQSLNGSDVGGRAIVVVSTL